MTKNRPFTIVGKSTKTKITQMKTMLEMQNKIGKSQTPMKSSLEISKVLRDSDLYLNPGVQ